MDRLVVVFFSPTRHRHLWQTICKNATRKRSSATIDGVWPSQTTCSSSLCNRRWQLSSGRFFSTASSSPSRNNVSQSHVTSPKQIYVWEQTISSSNANNASPDQTGADGKEIHNSKGRVLYTSVHNRNDKNTGWQMASLKTATDANNQTASSPSIAASIINSYKTKDPTNIQNLPFIHHFLPARYPQSVCPSYAQYASYCFLGSIAGSAAMVLSTQALLIAVGVGTQSAAPMAAALNWVMKDGVGQLGGVIFASQLGKGGIDLGYWRARLGKQWLAGGGSSIIGSNTVEKRGNYQRGTADSNPKRWRMVAALALDLSTLLEICTPLMGPEYFLPCASIANIGKNVGFLAASASRAAIHQSLSMGGESSIVSVAAAASPENTYDSKSSSASTASAVTTTARSSNLGDVTAKSGSQSIVASLLGTAIGILLSRTFCSDYGTAGILAGFVVLSAVHQVCTYKAVKVVPLRSLDRHRLHIVLTSSITDNCNGVVGSSQRNVDECGTAVDSPYTPVNGVEWKALTPSQVADKESFLPMMPPDDSVKWLAIGDSLLDICPLGVTELEGLLLPVQRTPNGNDNSEECEKYILKLVPPTIESTNGKGIAQLTFLEGATDDDILRGMFHAYTAHALMDKSCNSRLNVSSYDCIGNQTLIKSHSIMISQMPKFTEGLRAVGWQIGTGFVNVECGTSHRLKIESAF